MLEKKKLPETKAPNNPSIKSVGIKLDDTNETNNNNIISKNTNNSKNISDNNNSNGFKLSIENINNKNEDSLVSGNKISKVLKCNSANESNFI